MMAKKKYKYKFKTKPDPHQIEALKRAVKARKFGIFFQQRVGKTKVAIDFCGVESVLRGATKVLIVCPLSVRTEWGSQLADHLPVPYEFYLFPKLKAKRREMVYNLLKPDVLTFMVVNYDLLSNERDLLRHWKADIIIFDESHLLKNQAGKRSKAAYYISSKAEAVLLLTGTPIPKRWYDVFAQFRVMDSSIFGSRWTDFKRKYAVMGGYMGKQIVDCTDPKKISDIMAKHSIRVLRRDVFDEPKVEYVTIPVTLEPKAQKFYKTLSKQFTAELDGKEVLADMAIVRLMRLQQACGGFVPDEDGNMMNISKAKLKVITDLVTTHVEGGEPVVIFHRFSAEGVAITESLSNKGYRVAEFNGRTSEAGRLEARTRFQAEELDAIIIQISTGAMGVPLWKSHINIFYSMDFSLSNFQQGRDRVMGRYQKNDVTNYFLAVDKTVDHKIIKTLQNDEDVAASISDRWRWYLEED